MFRTMGTRASVNPLGGQAARRRAVSLGIDVPLLLVTITLLIIGLVMVFSASYDYSRAYYGDPARIFQRQVAWLLIGAGAAVFLTFLNYGFFRRFAVPILAGAIGLLLLVLVGSEVRNNAVRTLIGGSGQPSELAKLAIIVYLAVWLDAKRDYLGNITFGLLPLALILGFMSGLIVLQPDLSAVITIIFLGGIMFFLAGGDLRQIGLLLVIALLVGWAIVQLHPTGAERLGDYLAGLKDPTQGSYHVRRAIEAFVRGGWFGVGIGKADTKVTGLPFPHTDSIFAVVGEETGVIGASALVLLFGALLWRGMVIARRAPDQLGALLAGGLSLWLAVEAFVNMAVMINLMPIAGNALPFVSAGGSNLVVSLAAVGIMMNVSRRSIQGEAESGRTFGAVVDLRRRDRRGRVPRADRVVGAEQD
jgi:cell division protein FtsW